MSFHLLAFDCSFEQAGLALIHLESFLEQDIKKQNQTSREENLNVLKETYQIDWNAVKKSLGKSSAIIQKTWDSSVGSHSDQLPLKIKSAFEDIVSFRDSCRPSLENFWENPKGLNLKESNSLKKLLKAVVVGVGPGRFTGVRTAVSVAKALSYALGIPIQTANSLQLIAESYFEASFKESGAIQSQKAFPKVYVSLQAFKNQVYHGEFYPSDSKHPSLNLKQIHLLDFQDWEKKMIETLGEKTVCLSDLQNFYPIKPPVLEKLEMQKPRIHPSVLIKLAFQQQAWILDGKKVQANYMRLPV